MTGTGPIVAVADGSDGTDAALVAAALLSGRTGAEVAVLAVCEVPEHQAGRDPAVRGGTPDASSAQCRALRAVVERQVDDVVGEAAGWPVIALMGALGPAVHQVAAERRAQMVVVARQSFSGTTRPARVDVGQILGCTVAPLYVAAPAVTAIPTCAVVAVDFGTASVQAAHIVGNILSDGGMMYLVHVTPPFPQARPGLPSVAERADVLAALARLAISLAPSVTIRVRPTVLAGHVAEQILSFARGVHADLVACGFTPEADGTTFRSSDTVTATLVHDTVCSIIVTPHRPYHADA